jgi:predicted nucleotidyltransferase component of viral defense system
MVRMRAVFGAPDAQIMRDWVISLILAVISERAADHVLFYGGTALARTYLPEGRLSEDIDLIATRGRRDVAAHLDRIIPAGLRRRMTVSWVTPLSDTRGPDPAFLDTSVGMVKIQLIPGEGQLAWPTERVPLHQRYSQVASATLTVPTRDALAVWKTTAWCQRAASRDLWDLWALARIGALNPQSHALWVRYGTGGRVIPTRYFAAAPDEDEWVRDLGGQCRLSVTALKALELVRETWAVNEPLR